MKQIQEALLGELYYFYGTSFIKGYIKITLKNTINVFTVRNEGIACVDLSFPAPMA